MRMGNYLQIGDLCHGAVGGGSRHRDKDRAWACFACVFRDLNGWYEYGVVDAVRLGAWASGGMIDKVETLDLD